MNHTPEPWSHRGNQIEIWREHPETGTPQPQLIARVTERLDTGNAARIVAAVNACAGIPTAALEAGVIAEMREALEAYLGDRDAAAQDDDGRTWCGCDACCQARAVLAKLEADHASR